MISILCLKCHKRVLMRRSFIQWWVLFLIVRTVLLTRPIEGLLHLSCDAVETESYSWFISWSGATHLLSILDRLLSILKHGQVIRVSCIFKSSDNWFFYSEFLHWIRRVCSKSQLSHLRWIPVLRVRIIRSSRLLRAQLVVALDNYGPKLEGCFLVRSLNIDQKSGPPRIIDARLIIRGCLSFLCAAPSRIVKDLQTSLASCRLLAVS